MKAILSALEDLQPQGNFCVRLTAPADDLKIRVGDGPQLSFPLTHDVVRDLISQAQPAKFGWRDQTLQDSQVRNTWEIPTSRVHIDQRRWEWTLHPFLIQIKDGLGLDDGARLTASLHNMLIYEKGQFFQPHQDTEKEEGMVATLVVALPCAHTGGGLVIDHGGEKKRIHTSRAAAGQLTFVAFYADCHHEVRPVTSGYRVVLTYNLLLEGASGKARTPAGSVAAAPLTQALQDYFHRRAAEAENRSASRGGVPSPPKWVYLLDHQYTQKSLSWRQLKNADRLRADVIAQAAAALGLERYMALADIQEIWDCEFDYGDRYYRSRRRYRYAEPDGDTENYRPTYLIDNSISLRHWVSGTDDPADLSELSIRDDEVCWTTATDAFDPFSSEYEGWMGNYGNTLERWYHRAAIVLWRREDHYAMLCAIDPGQLVKDLKNLASNPSTRAEVPDIVTGILPYWPRAITASREVDDAWTQSIFDLALQVQSPETAHNLVSPFSLRVMDADTANAFMALAQQYGTPWAIQILEQWAQNNSGFYQQKLIDGFLTLIQALRQVGQGADRNEQDNGAGVIRWLLSYQFDTMVAYHAMFPGQAGQSPSRVAQAGELLDASVAAGSAEMHTRVADHLVNHEGIYDPLDLAQLLLQLKTSDDETQTWGHPLLLRHVVAKLTDERNRPIREKDDWSMTQQAHCRCEDCQTLNAYLRSSSQREKKWPLAKQRRAHIHRALDALRVPVTHQTLRQGSPYRLVLKKTDDLFRHEALRREQVTQVLDRLPDIA